MYYVYCLRSINYVNQFYIGYTEDLRIRFKRHNEGLVRSTKPYRPWKLIFYEAFESKKDAKRREKYLKTTKGRKGLKLILRDTLLK